MAKCCEYFWVSHHTVNNQNCSIDFSRENFNQNTLKQKLLEIQWTPQLATEWQKFYDNAAHGVFYGGGIQFETASFATLPKYEDLKVSQCKTSSANCEKTFSLFVLFTLVMRKIFLE